MIRFLDFHETLALACNAAGSFYVYGEHEAPILVECLKAKKAIRAVVFETTLGLDICTLALSYDVPVFFPGSLEELYRAIINAPATAVIYIYREIMRMKEAYETSGYLTAGELRQIPGKLYEISRGGDIEQALDIYARMEESYKKSRPSHGAAESTPRRGRMMRLYKKGNASVCVVVLGYVASMVHYLLSKSQGIDVAAISGFSRRVLRELKLLTAGYDQIIWIAPAQTICSDMIRDKGMRRIVTRDMDELHSQLMAALPRNMRKELHYPGRPEEWPARHLPPVPPPERRMCPGCVHRSRGVDTAHCEKLGIDVYRSESRITSGDRAAPGGLKAGEPGRVIGRRDESCIRTAERGYAIKRFLCDGCGICVEECGCPAIVSDSLGVVIDPAMCTGCGDCGDICPNGAIYSYE